MTVKRYTDAPERFSLRRWSQRKLAVARKPSLPSGTSTPPATGSPPAGVPETPPSAAVAAKELPPVESLTFDSEFAQFLKPDVDETIKRAALRKLLRDPRFNVMDGLDTYIDDYTKADPIPPDVLADLLQRFGSIAEMDQSPAVAANVPAENPVAATPVTERAVAEKPATETKVTEIAARGGDSGTTPPAPLQSAKIAAKRAASAAAEREEERAL